MSREPFKFKYYHVYIVIGFISFFTSFFVNDALKTISKMNELREQNNYIIEKIDSIYINLNKSSFLYYQK